MIRLAKQDWDKFLRDNNPEVFTEEQINAWIESNRDLLVKAEGETLSAQDNQFVQDFRTEISHFTKVEVLRPNDDKLQKSLVHEIFYIREKQVDWDEEIIKSEDGEEFSFGTYRETSLNNKLGRVGNLIEKGKRGQLGEVREWKGGKYKKTAQGWVPVSDGKQNSTGKVKDLNIFSHKEGGYGATAIVNGDKVSMKLPKEFTSKISSFDDKGVREKVKEMLLNDSNKNQEEDQPKGEEKAKLLKEVFESMDFLGINREDFSEMKKEHGGLKKLNEYLSEELSGRYKKGDKIEFDGITIHVGRNTSGGQDTLEYSAPEINNKKYWSLNKLKEIIKEHNEKNNSSKEKNNNKNEIEAGDSLVDDEGFEFVVRTANKAGVFLRDEDGEDNFYSWKQIKENFEKITDNSTMSRSDESTTKKIK